MKNKFDCIVVLGPTASGKTKLACQIALHFNGEIISADSRQVYNELNIGTGKDLHEYTAGHVQIPVHLLNIADPRKQFYLHEYQEALKATLKMLFTKQTVPVICGGTGMYLDALRKDFVFTQVPENKELRLQLAALSKTELTDVLASMPSGVIAHVDFTSTKRMIRGVEIAMYLQHNQLKIEPSAINCQPLYIGIESPVEKRRREIAERLQQRLNDGLIEEVQQLLSKGVSHKRLQMLGLEYKFVSEHLQGKLNREELEQKLLTAIIQYAKRQMTWFRKMEKEGVQIRWFRKEEWPTVFAEVSKYFPVHRAI
jgi:tRNA dimethylallyltransferase